MKQKILMMASTSVFGVIGLFVRNIDLPTPELAMFRAIIAIITILAYKVIARQSMPWPAVKKALPLLFLSGVAIALDWIFFFLAVRLAPVSIATLTYYFEPTLVMIACTLLFKEHLTPRRLFCFFMATLGLVLIIGVSSGVDTGETTMVGIGCALTAAVFYTIIVILNKYVKDVDGIDRTLIQFVAALVVLVPFVLLTEGLHIGGLSTLGWVNLIILGILPTGIAYCVYFNCMRGMSGQEIAITSYFDPMVAVLVSVVVLGEPISALQLLGGAMILGFTLYNELRGDA